MNDSILSGLLNLFALFGAQNGLDKSRSVALISDYLKRYFSVRSPQSYLNLYSDLRDYYDDFPDLDRETIMNGICGQLQSRIPKGEQAAMLLRLLEFCSIGASNFDPQDPIFRHTAQSFGISDDIYSDLIDFVLAKPGDSVLVIDLDGGAGQLKTLYLRPSDTLMFTYVGNRQVLMNDVPVMSGVFQVWQQSGVLKCRDFAPIYYSTIKGRYEKWQPSNPVDLCGRDVDFRFDEGGDIGMHNFSFSLHSGQLVAIMGGSGVGKSTLLSLLNGNLKPQRGTITINGHDIGEPSAKALIGYVPQDDLLIEELTVYQNLWYTAKLCFDGLDDLALDKKVMDVLVSLGLDAAKDLKVGSPINKYISGGQRKRLNIALELIREPAILFLDEPTSGLSSTDTEKVINLLKEQTTKGKLIVVNIHQPSSDVYKLFDRLWLLDKGGYPVFDGNPIDAITYFKSAANYADAQTSACPVCGNVNPEVVLDIIDEKSIDNAGQITEKRKVTPQEWHSLYLSNRGDFSDAALSDVPETDQKRPGVFKQMLLFLQRNVVSKLTNLQYMLVTLLEAPLLACICAALTKYTPDGGVYSIMDNKNLTSYIFMAIIVAIFLGMSGSAEEIIRDRALLKREKFLSLSYRSYIWSKMIYMAGVCLVQTFLFITVGNFIIGIQGMFWIWWMVLFLSAFLSSLIGLLLSQCLNSVVAIYISIPLLLIPQILLCGLVVDFEDLNPGSKTGNVPIIGDVIPSRWSYEALAVASFTMNDYEKDIYERDCDKYSLQYYESAFIYELESRLERIQDEKAKGLAEDPMHMAAIRRGLTQLREETGVNAYQGDWSYDSLDSYFKEAKNQLSRRGNKVTLDIEKTISAYVREHGVEELMNLKKANYSLQLERLLLRTTSPNAYMVVDDCIVARTGFVFLTPLSCNGRAPFYSGVKVVGTTRIPTLWFNMGVLLLMSILFALCLLYDFPGSKVRKERN